MLGIGMPGEPACSAVRLDFYFVAVRQKCNEPSLVGSEYRDMMLRETFQHSGMGMVELVLITIRDEREARAHLLQKLFR